MRDDESREIAGFRIESEIGRGGMGVVYLAHQSFPERKVALKLLSPDLADDPAFRERFIRESNAAAAIEHPNIVPVHAAGDDGGRLYLAMRYVEGTDLRSTLERDGALSPERAARICAQIADALEAAHERGLVHRDVKPGNVLLDSREHAYLSDFGLIKPTQTGTEFTKTGQFMGSVEYVAPEQIRGGAVDGRADTYSLGCVLFECLTGRAPFHRETEVATLYAHLEEPAPNPKDTRSDVPTSLAAVVERSMAKRPEERFASASDMAAGLRGASPPGGPSPRRPRALVIGVAAAVIAIVVMLAIVASVSGDDTDAAGSSPLPSVVPDSLSASLAHADAESGEILSITHDLPRPEEALPQVEVGEGSVWVLTSGKLTQVDPNDGSVVGVTTMRGLLPVDSRSLATGSRTVWVGDWGLVHRVHPATGDELRPVALWGATDPGGVAYVAVAEGNAWAVGEDGSLVRIDPLTASKDGSVDVSQSASGIGAGFDAVWVVDDLHTALIRVDATTLEIVATYHAPGDMNAIAVGAGAVWLLDSNAGVVTPFNPSTGGFGAPIRVGIGPTDVATGLGSVWVTNQGEDSLSRVDPITGKVETTPIGGPAAAIAIDEPTETVWVVLAQVSKGGAG